MTYRIRYRRDTPLGVRYPESAGSFDTREAAEQFRRLCANAENMEVIES